MSERIASLARAMTSRVARFGCLLAAYAGAVALLTYPLAARLTTHLPATVIACSFDTLYMAWVLAFESHALLTGASLLDTNIFFPARRTLFLGDTGFGALPIFFPVFATTGNPTLAINLVWLIGLVLTAASLHLVVRRWTTSDGAGFVAAWTFLTAPWVYRVHIPSAPSYALLLYMPVILYLAATPRAGRDVLWLWPLLVLQGLSDVVYVAAAVMAPLLVLGVVRLLRPSTRAAGTSLLLVLLLSILTLAPVYAGHWLAQQAHPGMGTWWEGPPVAVRLPGAPFARLAPLALAWPVWVLVGLGLVVYFVAGRRKDLHRAWAHAALWASVGAYASLGPLVSWGSGAGALPHAWLATQLHLYEVLRMPSRLGVAALIGVAVAAGLAFSASTRRLHPAGRLLAAALFALLLITVERIELGGYWTSPAIDGEGEIVRVLRAGQGPLLELPIGSDKTGDVRLHAQAMYRSIFHWRPLVNGYDSYYPAGFSARMELAAVLPRRNPLWMLQHETGVTQILVHLDQMVAADAERWRGIAITRARPDLRPVLVEKTEILFDVLPVPGTPRS